MLQLRAPCLVGYAAFGVVVLGACSGVKTDFSAGPRVEAFYSVEATSPYGVVATSCPAAAHAGVQILEAGGNAVDAAVATALALAVADPGDSGLGGQTYMVLRLANGRILAIDGSAVIPVATDFQILRKCESLRSDSAPPGHALAAVPGTIAALDLASRRYGTLPFSELVHPAIEIAERGYVITPFQVAALAKYHESMVKSEPFRFFFLKDGHDLPEPGTRACWPELATTLRRLASDGAASFYTGTIADEIAEDMWAHGGFISKGDLLQMRARELEPIRSTYRGYEIVSFPEPGAGGAVIEGLNILETFPPQVLAGDSVDRLQAMAEAFHIALEDYRRYSLNPNVAPAFQNRTFTEKSFAAKRAHLIRFDRPISPQDLPSVSEYLGIEGQTVQVSVADRWGNVVSLTQSLGRFYGGRALTASLGFPYNDFLGTFIGRSSPIARARGIFPSEMSPTIVLKDGQPIAALGTAGSSRIPSIIASVISNLIDRRMPLRQAVMSPRVLWSDSEKHTGICLEVYAPITGADLSALEERGYHNIRSVSLPVPMTNLAVFGAVNAFLFDPATGMQTGIGDPRRSGFAAGASW